MLVGIHQNASVWYLFAGDRGVVDTLLNKKMISMPPHANRKAFAYLLFSTHYLQLLAMTFTTGQKAWDGLMLVLLKLLEYMWRL
jgi:hypothetical protein